MALYLLHFTRPHFHNRHYLGFTETVEGVTARIKRHRAGTGARLIKQILRDGNDFVLARIWPVGDRAMERKLKRKKNGPGLCPICQAEKPKNGRQ